MKIQKEAKTLFVLCNSENWKSLFVRCNNRWFRSNLEDNSEGRHFSPFFVFYSITVCFLFRSEISVSLLLSLGLDLIFIWFKVWLSGLLGYEFVEISCKKAWGSAMQEEIFFFFFFYKPMKRVEILLSHIRDKNKFKNRDSLFPLVQCFKTSLIKK